MSKITVFALKKIYIYKKKYQRKKKDMLSWCLCCCMCHVPRAEITLPRVTRDLLMLAPSFSLVPVARVASTLSLPARSTRWILLNVSRGKSASNQACGMQKTLLSNLLIVQKRQRHGGILGHIGSITTKSSTSDGKKSGRKPLKLEKMGENDYYTKQINKANWSS